MCFKSIFGGGVDPKRLCKKIDDDLAAVQDHVNSGAPAGDAAPDKVRETLDHLHRQLGKMRGAFFGTPPDHAVDASLCEKIGDEAVARDLFKRLVLASLPWTSRRGNWSKCALLHSTTTTTVDFRRATLLMWKIAPSWIF